MPIDSKQPYDDCNIFARILRGDLPSKTVLETDHASPFTTSTRSPPIHAPVIPKGAYVSWDDFSEQSAATPRSPL